MPYLCQPCNDRFDSVKLFDEHLSQEHSMHVSAFPSVGG